ncbi:hypothetical protein F5Y14DRAFT_173340 [Nemania sp. NC0429]|nr:hypothetical protein F5Y14DRAFT_173340 [Nemania sp. NC0429]
MGHQESSSPPHHRRHYHHHHHRPRHHHHHHPHNRYSHLSATQTANRDSVWSSERLNRESHTPNRHAFIESWLGQVTAAPVSLTRPASPQSRNQPVHCRKRPRPKDRHISPRGQHAEGVDPLRRRAPSPPCPPLPIAHPRQYTRSSGDSSLIRGLSPQREPGERVGIKSISEHEESLHSKPHEEVEVDVLSAWSPTSCASAAPAFEKRPRHKTRPDKYDAKKLGSREKRKVPPDQEQHRPKKSKSRKKHPVTGKNVMNNFASEAVLGDRITMKPGLKPGMFDNKRVSERIPVTDLSFLEMPLPTNRDRDVPQQKGLSSSRLRERQRESLELERVSSFFLPASTEATSRKVKSAQPKDNKGNKCKKATSRDNMISLDTPSSPTLPTRGHHQHSSVSQEPIPTVTPGDRISGSGSSRATYITWSSSHPSPKARRDPVSTEPRSIEPPSSATPENIRRDLIATGVYEGTGIRSYDVSGYQQKLGRKSNGEPTSSHRSIVGHVDTCEAQVPTEDRGLKTASTCLSDTRDTVVLLPHQEERWNTILPPEWRLRRLSDVEMSSTDKQQNDEVTDIPKSVKPPNRQEIAQEARFEPIRESSRAQCAHRHIDHNHGTYSPTSAGSPVLVPPEPGQIVNQAESAGQGRDTIASRDAMPPPPVPPARSNNSHLINPELRGDTSSSICLGATRPLDTHVQIFNNEPSQATDPDTATEQPHESGREHDRVIPTLDSVSWIPQATTSDIVTYEREKTLSRLSTRSLVYEPQSKEQDFRGDLCLPPQAMTPVAESMADFIRRIESEIEESTYMDEYCQSELITEAQGSSLDLETSTDKTYNRRPIAFDESRINYHQFPDHITDPGFKAVPQTIPNFRGYEERAGCLQEASTTTTTSDTLKDDINEFPDMSTFWRLNRFSHS